MCRFTHSHLYEPAEVNCVALSCSSCMITSIPHEAIVVGLVRGEATFRDRGVKPCLKSQLQQLLVMCILLTPQSNPADLEVGGDSLILLCEYPGALSDQGPDWLERVLDRIC